MGLICHRPCVLPCTLCTSHQGKSVHTIPVWLTTNTPQRVCVVTL